MAKLQPRVTMVDVARRAGVSRTTASFVLTGRDDQRVSKDAWQRVLDAAEALNYRPNLNARGLRTNTTQTIGMISDTIATTQFAGDIVRGAVEAALERDHLLLIAETEGAKDLEDRLIMAMLDRQVDGFVYAAMSTRRVDLPPLIQDAPLVLLNCFADDSDVPVLIPDELEAGRAAARALTEAGHCSGIFVIGGLWKSSKDPEGKFAGHERLQGISEVFGAAGVSLAGVIECPWEVQNGYEVVQQLLRNGDSPRALICMNDRVSLGAYQALKEFGWAIPADVSIVSFDDQPLASWLRPSLSSVKLPHYEMGRAAVERLLGADGALVTRIPMPLIERDSIAAPAQRSIDDESVRSLR